MGCLIFQPFGASGTNGGLYLAARRQAGDFTEAYRLAMKAGLFGQIGLQIGNEGLQMG